MSQLLAEADAGRIKDQGRPVRAEEIANAIDTGLNDSSFFGPVATGIQRALQTGAMGDLTQLTSAKNGDYPLYRAIICQDIPVPAVAASQFPAEAAKVRALAPTLRGYSEFWDIASGCAGWPTPARWTPHQWRVPASFPPVLLTSGAYDVATPRPWAENVHRALPGSTLVRWDGDGHAAWPAHSPSTVAAEISYLTRS
ncbi:alpha/beta hydrolase [Fodinicola feengrottensis]|uniref:alpha/beta hydrolase n=1 Tax=Fodinicola feengrottensis TaxID=435914 RepID=UPI0031D33381